MQVSPRDTSLQETTPQLSVDSTRSTLRSCTDRERSLVPALHCTALTAVSRPIARRVTSGGRQCMGGAPVNSHHQPSLGSWRRWPDGVMSSPGSTATHSPITMHKSKPCAGVQSRGKGGQEIRPAARSQSQKARGGTKVVPWRRASGRAPEWPENRVHAAPGATGVPMVRGGTGLDRTRHHPGIKRGQRRRPSSSTTSRQESRFVSTERGRGRQAGQRPPAGRSAPVTWAGGGAHVRT